MISDYLIINYQNVKVRTCNDAHIALMSSTSVEVGSLYEIVIGGWSNRQSCIREQKQGPCEIKVDTENVLDCDNFAAFWIEWIPEGTGRKLLVGHGSTLGQDMFMDYNDFSPHPLNHMAIAGWRSGWSNVIGYWRIGVGKAYTWLNGCDFFFRATHFHVSKIEYKNWSLSSIKISQSHT